MSRIMKSKVLAGVAAGSIGIALFGCAGAGDSGDPDTVDVAIQPTATGFPLWLAEKEGFYDDNDVEVSLTYYSDGSAMSESGATGAWEAGALGSPPAITSSDKWDLRVVGPNAEEGKAQVLWGRSKDFQNKKPADVLRGSEVLVKTNSTQHYALLGCMTSMGIDNDFKPLQVEADAIPGAFSSGEGIGAMTWPPFDAKFTDSSQYVRVCDGQQSGIKIYNMLAVTPTFADDQPDQAAGFVRAIYQANEFINQNPDRAAQMLVEFYDENGITAERADARRELDERTWPTAKEALNLYESGDMAAALKDLSKTFVSLGAFQEQPDIDALIEGGQPVLKDAQE